MADGRQTLRGEAEAERCSFEDRSRNVFEGSLADVDLRVRSRLTRARHAALDAAAAAKLRSPWLAPMFWRPAAGVTAAVLIAVALWSGLPGDHGLTAVDGPPALEDLDIVAASDEAAGDSIEMLQNDLDFYDFAERAANPEPAA